MSSSSQRRSFDSPRSPFSPPQQHQAQFPFPPQHDWAASGQGHPRASSSSRPAPCRTSSIASSIHSIGSTLDTAVHARPGTVTEVGQNAISALLQPPIVRTGLLPHTASSAAASSHKPPTAKDIPPVSLTNIPHVEPSTFRPYLSQVGSLYDAFQRAKAESDGGSQLRRDKTAGSKADDFSEALEKGLRKASAQSPRPTSRGSLSGVTFSPSIEAPEPRRRSSAAFAKRNAVTPLSTIPNVYFEDDFHLENPRTFDIVSERSEVVRPPNAGVGDDAKGANGSLNGAPPSGRKALATNAILQEKLSWYMDTVEVHLIQAISTASTSFFAALGSLKDLQFEAAESARRIKHLRKDLERLDKEMAVGGLKVVAMKRRRENLRKLADATEQLRCVVDGVAACEEMVENGNLELALDCMDVLDTLISGTIDRERVPDSLEIRANLPQNLIDLRSLKALEGVAVGLSQLRYRVGKGYETRFLEALLTDVRDHVKSVPAQDTLQRWANTFQRTRGDQKRPRSQQLPAYLKTNDALRSDLRAILHGLSRANHTGPATYAFREVSMREVKSLIRQHLPSSSDDDTESMTSISTRGGRGLSQQDKSAILARNLRALDAESAEELLRNVYSNVGEALRRLGVQVKVLLDVTSGVASPPPSSGGLKSPPRSPSIVGLDGQVNRPVTPEPPALGSWNLQEELTQTLDMSSLLGQAVDVAQSQITKVLKVRTEQTTHLPLQLFLRYFTLNRLFADECEAVSGRSGAALKGTVNGQIHDFVSLLGDSEKQRLAQVMDADKWEAKDFGDAENAVLSRLLDGMTSDPPAWLKGTLVWQDLVDEREVNGTNPAQSNGTGKTKARSATIDEEKYILVDCTLAALRGIDTFENLAAAIPSITTDVSTVLVDYLKLYNSRSCQLILGAGARSAGLKNINTKHLALASQSLSFIVALIPYLREFARRHSPPNHHSLTEFDKVKRLYQDHQVSIHDKLIDIMSSRTTAHINAMKKIDFDKATEQQISPHMETLTNDTSVLHRVLNRHLPEISVRLIMGPVFTSYREQWGKAFSDVDVKTMPGKDRLLRDAEHFDAKLSKIDGAGDIGNYIINIVKGKKVAEAPPPPPPPSSKETEKANGVGDSTESKPSQEEATNDAKPEEEDKKE
ncbi:Vps54-like protein-domain-containing protein [Lineolata rhizophorae]|uniref:Vacuolar protein sorting-associated protein 54 n=1 Tax=Lineolata rhizophorae TaxID=578093 RepID=A0A6A6NUM9_9PEZI|nr:Vps54-like protein-domain-containing protein [Lineolata rhizophorae]